MYDLCVSGFLRTVSVIRDRCRPVDEYLGR